jgi:hypothetical protein
MTLQAQFEQELKNLGSSGAKALSLTAEPQQLSCDVVQSDALAVSFNSLRLATSQLAEATVVQLERISKSLADRLNYLMEPISPIETDADACTVQMRSNPPQRDDDGRTYFELIVRRGGELALVRYRKDNGNARQQVAATVTREVLLRLVGDFEAVLE